MKIHLGYYFSIVLYLFINAKVFSETVTLNTAGRTEFTVENDQSLTISANVETDILSPGSYMIRIKFKRGDGVIFELYSQGWALYSGSNSTPVNFTLDNNLFQGTYTSGVIYAEIEKQTSGSSIYKSQEIPASQTPATTTPPPLTTPTIALITNPSNPSTNQIMVKKDETLFVSASVVAKVLLSASYSIRVIFESSNGALLTLFNGSFFLGAGENSVTVNFNLDYNTLFKYRSSGDIHAELQSEVGGLTAAPVYKSSQIEVISNTLNSICCNQCILAGQVPEPLIQTPGTIFPYGDINTSSWRYLPDGYCNYGTPTDNGNPTCTPDPSTRTARYERNYVNQNSSNFVIIYVSPLKPYLAVGTKNYVGNTTVSAYDIGMQGQLSSSSSATVNFTAAHQIVISSPSTLTSNATLRIDPSIFNCNNLNPDFSRNCSLFREATVDEDNQVKTEFKNDKISYPIAYPNPTNGETTIKFSVAEKDNVELFVNDNSGKFIATLINSQNVEPGNYEIVFDTKDLVPGIYFYTVITNGQKTVKKLIVTGQSQAK